MQKQVVGLPKKIPDDQSGHRGHRFSFTILKTVNI